MTYKERIKLTMEEYAKNPKVRFIGYNTACGHQMYGTLSGCPRESIIETPVAENLMCGLAMGMAINGLYPILCFERSAFLMAAMDAITNHMDLLQELSGSQYKMPIIVRVVLPTITPLDPGIQHSGKHILSQSTRNIVHLKVEMEDINNYTTDILNFEKIKRPIMLYECKELWDQETK